MKNVAVFGIFRDQTTAEDAIGSLRSAGFRGADISVLFSENKGTKDIGVERHTKAPEVASAGAATGAVIGGALGWLASIGALAIPGIGPFIAAGPLMAALSGLGAGGVLGGLTGALIGTGIPEYEAKRYEGRIRSGGILLSVHCDNREWVRKAEDILRANGADDIAHTSEARGDFANQDKPVLRGIHVDKQ